MKTFFKYIVCFLLAFNTFECLRAEVILSLDQEEADEDLRTPFINAGSLPHPVQLRQILDNEDDSSVGRLLLLGRYFDAKYPGDALKKDIKDEVALIFPEYDKGKIEEIAHNIQMSIAAYRLGKQKADEIKQKLVAPEDPPLIVDDDEYALPGDRDYLFVEDGQYAVITDIKKVVGYGNNKREIKATEEKLRRDAEKSRPKTDFEKFQQMWDKIEFSKIPSYGVTLPNPFVGNAGIGNWVKDDGGYRARLISELARTGKTKEVLLGFHVDVPNHRLMLSLPFKKGLQKPVINLKNTKNIASFEVFYPLPVQTLGVETAAVYRGNFVFPVKIVLEDPSKPTFLQADLTFDDCDFEFLCVRKTLSSALEIEPDEAGDNISSSMAQFIRQSFYNLPQEKDKYLSLKNVSYDEDTHQLYFDFVYDAKPKNFALMLENEDLVSFSAPKMTMTKDHIYARVDVLGGPKDFKKSPLTIYARLNDYSFLKKTINLSDFKAGFELKHPFKVFIFAFFVGVLFCLTPFGFLYVSEPFSGRVCKAQILSKIVVLSLSAVVLILSFKMNPGLFYIGLKNNLFYLGVLFSVLFIKIFGGEHENSTNKRDDIFLGLYQGLWGVLFLELIVTPYQQDLMLDFTSFDFMGQIICCIGLVLGLTIFDFIGLYGFRKKINPKVAELIGALAQIMLWIAFGVVAFYIFSMLDWFAGLKVVLLLCLAFLALKYLLNFKAALYWADLSKTQIRHASKAVNVLIFLSVLIFAKVLQGFEPVQRAGILSIEAVEEKVREGKNVLVIVEGKGCIKCIYNNMTALSSFNLKGLDLDVIRVNTDLISPNMRSYFKEFYHLQIPLYVFYNPLIPDGVVLDDLLSETDLKRTIETFKY